MMKSAYFTIHPDKNPPPQNGGWLKSVPFLKHRFHILHFPNSTGLFIKPTGRHYTKYRFSPDIGSPSDGKFKGYYFQELTGLGTYEGSTLGCPQKPWQARGTRYTLIELGSGLENDAK
jgi:hypothetical protein